MFLHIGNNIMVRKDKIILVLDLDTAGSNQISRSLLNKMMKKGNVQNITEKGKEKSFVMTDSEYYLSPISSSTLMKRSQSGSIL
ncbi:extracellular matrix regulator RemB [Dehalobacter sp. TBBPA1]|uniref:extracellular matrix regulator RemB n=1 Tax=Dehalobacter sp. TBBPA1 TaxID=3235037 RepID=UPI0034A18E57